MPTIGNGASVLAPRPDTPRAFDINERFSTTLTTDFKATPNLVLSLGLIYNWSDLFMAQQAVIFNSGARTAVGGADPLVAYTSAPAGTVAVGPQRIAKAGQILTVLPKVEYRLGELLLEGRFSDSIARAWYDPLTKHSSIRSMVNPTASNVAFRAERTDAMSTDWRVTQTAGPDLGNGALFTSPEANINDGRRSRTEVYSGELVATLRTRRFAPVTWKAGLKSRRDVFDFRSELGAIRYNYVGPGGGATGGWAAFASPLVPDPGAAGGSITTLSGRPVFMPDMRRIGQTFRERPEYFLLNVPANTYFNARVANTRHYEEQIDAAFLMGTAALGRATVRAGLRREETSNASLEFDPRSNAEVRAAGFPVNTRATTIPGIDYQFLSRPRIKREGGYDNLFPSASFKYDFTPQLNFHAGYSSTIRRPTVSDVAGVWLVNDLTSRATVPNAQLRPETSDNTSVRLAYYFEPVGIVGVSVYQNSVRDLHRTNELSAEQFGNTDPDLDSYRFITTSNTPGLVRIRGLELEYSQSLSFLPRPLRGLSIRGSYTRNYAEIIVPRMAPHTASAGLACNWRRASLTLNGRWSDDVPTNDTGTEYIRHRTSLDLNGAFHLTARYSLSFSARNLTNAPQFDMTKPGPGPALWDRHQVYGTTWTFSVKGVF